MDHDSAVRSVAALFHKRMPGRDDDDDMYDDLLTIVTRRVVASVDIVGLEAETCARIWARWDHALQTLQGGELLNVLLDLQTELMSRSLQDTRPTPHVFCWGRSDDDGELAAIARVLGENQALVEEACRYEGAGIAYRLAELQVSLAGMWRVIAATGVMGPPSRDADGVPLLSKSEIDRVVPAKFGVDDA